MGERVEEHGQQALVEPLSRDGNDLRKYSYKIHVLSMYCLMTNFPQCLANRTVWDPPY